jgi:hypothetical protein
MSYKEAYISIGFNTMKEWKALGIIQEKVRNENQILQSRWVSFFVDKKYLNNSKIILNKL